MSSKGQLAHLGVKKESTWGTPLGADDYLKFSSETLTLAIEELISASLSANREEPDSFEGLGGIAGDTTHEVHPDEVGYLLHSFCASSSSSNPGTAAYQHVFLPSDTPFSSVCDVQPYTIEVERNTASAFQFSGMAVNTLAFAFGVGSKILNLTASWLGKDVANIAKTSPTMPTTEPFRWNQAVISIGGSSAAYLETCNWTLENGLIAVPLLDNTKRVSSIMGDTFRSGTIAPTIDIGQGALADWVRFTGWTTAAWGITFTGASIESGQAYTLQFEFPKVLYTAFPIGVAGPGRVTVGASGKIKYDSAAGHAFRVTLKNAKASY